MNFRTNYNRMNKLLTATFIFSFIGAIHCQQVSYIKYVDPMIGTGGHGHTFPGATVPFGMVQLSPDTRKDGSWDGCSGYHYSDSVIFGFSHTHLSGTGCSDYGDILLMPMSSAPNLEITNFPSRFTHANEKASAGYYSVKLDNGVNVDLTATARVGVHKYTYPADSIPWIILDLAHRDKTLEASLNVVNQTEIEGMRRSEAWAKDQHIYFVARFSQPFEEHKQMEITGLNLTSKHAFRFVKTGKPIIVKVGISSVSMEGARKNLDAELADFDFDKTKKNAENLWNKELGKIDVTSGDNDKLKIFYTALYHTMIQPNVASDVDGMYRGRDNQIHKAEGYTYYSVFSLWDTFRAAHPLYTIIDRKRTLDFIKTFLAQYKEGGRLPVWELAGNETDCMIGYHAVSVIADAAAKGIKDFDMNYALEAMKHSATTDHYGIPEYMDHGFISMEDDKECVSKTVEYAYDDWCVAQMAKLMNKQDDYVTFSNRAQYWKNVFDRETNFMRPRKNGGWLSPFEPREVNNYYTEGNAWQYTFFVPQDIPGLIDMMGGPDKFDKKLDELFTTTTKTTGREQVDITGLIGQYAHGNEPSHHMAYLYNYVGKSSKTQEKVHQIITQFYRAAPDGLIGNEDCGQMSAWYVLSSMGIYEVTPGSGNYLIGTPSFSKVKINLENGKAFTVSAPSVSNDNIYIESATKNGTPFNERYITYNDINTGAQLVFNMGNAPRTAKDSPLPPASEATNPIVFVPLIQAPSRVFKNHTEVELKTYCPSCKLYYTIDGTIPYNKSLLYTSPFKIDETTIIKTIAINEKGEQSFINTATLYKKPNDWKIKINSTYNPQYTGGGDEGVIDGVRGDKNWSKGDWQGYQGQDFEAVVDLGKETELSIFGGGFLQDSKSWILMPTKLEFYSSPDNVNFTLVTTVSSNIDATDTRIRIIDIKSKINKPITTRYIKVKAYNYGKLPDWHIGAGGEAFVFIDEIILE